MPPAFPRNAAALLVGVGRYARGDRIPGLRYAARDARALARLLTDADVCGFPRSRVAILTDADATRAAIDRHLSRWLPARPAVLKLSSSTSRGTASSKRQEAVRKAISCRTTPIPTTCRGTASP